MQSTSVVSDDQKPSASRWSDASHRAETAYPRLKNQIREKKLTEIYAPTLEELNLDSQHARKGATKLGFLVLLKTFQRLGYFVAPTTIPSAIVKHIAHSAALACPPNVLKSYDTSGTRW